MCKEISRILMAALCVAALSACGGDPDKKAAQELLKEAEAELAAGNHMQALALMDTIDQKYGAQVEVRRQAMGLRPRAIEISVMEKISSADSILAATQIEINELEGKFKHISGDDLEGYYIVADAPQNFINSTGIQPRINDSNYMFYMVAQTAGKNIGIRQISLSSADGTMASQEIPSGSARVVTIEGSELATFLPEEVNDLGAWAANNANAITNATIIGNKGSQNVKLTSAQAQAIGTAWKYGTAKQRNRQAAILREKLDRQLQIARDQAAQHTQEPQK